MTLPELEDWCREAVGTPPPKLADRLAEHAEPLGNLSGSDEVGRIDGIGHGCEP